MSLNVIDPSRSWTLPRDLQGQDGAGEVMRARPGPAVDGGPALGVLVVADELEPHGGAERSQVDVAEELAARGHRIRVVFSRPGSFLERYEQFTTSMTRVPAAQGDGSRVTDSRLLAAAARAVSVAGDVDVVYANSIRLTFLGQAVSRVRRVPMVCHLRLPHPPNDAVKTRIGLSAVTRFIAVSEHTRANHVLAGLDPARIDVVHNGIDLNRFPLADAASRDAARADLDVARDAFVVAYVGRLDADKGVEVLTEAWGASTRGTDVLLVAGAPRSHASAGAARTWVEALRARVVDCDVRWLGLRLDVVPLLAAADVVVMPSLFSEPFGRVAIEAMSSGVPVVVTQVGGLPEVLGGRFPGMLVPPGDAAALWAAIDALRGWRERDPELPVRLRDHVQQRFSLAATARGVERVLREVAAG